MGFEYPKNRYGVLDRIENYTEGYARGLLSRQINFDTSVKTLSDLSGRAALRNGRKFDTELIVQNSRNHQLWKVALVDDVLVSDRHRLRTRTARQQLQARRSIFSKLRRYFFSSADRRFVRLWGYVSARVRHFFLEDKTVHPHRDIEWAHVNGVNFWQQDDGTYICVDHGAIYEDFLATDTNRFPSQVGSDLYTSSNAAYLFKWMADREASVEWFDAVSSAQSYFLNFYHYPRQRLEFDHREFDFTALRLTFDRNIFSPFAGWTVYDPVNVFGLRWDYLAQAPEERTVIRMATTRLMVTLNQSKDGLIRDNHMGRAVHAGDLTYHHYCLAGLALGNAVLDDPLIDRVVQKGLLFSISMQLPNGEVGFYGRGANNNYHLAAFIAALAVAAARYKWDLSKNIFSAVHRLCTEMLPYPYENSELMLPTAMNNSPVEKMVGWHGSCAQYGALSSFLLARSVPFLRQISESENEKAPFSLPFIQRPVHASIKSSKQNEQIVLAVTAGSECMPWNNGQHVSGYAGLTALYFAGRNRLLTNERVLQDDGQAILISDLPDQSAYDRGMLKKSSDKLELLLQGGGGKRKIIYFVKKGAWSVSVNQVNQTASYSLPLQGNPNFSQKSDRSFSLRFDDGVFLNVTTKQSIKIDTFPVSRSCHGAGILFRINSSKGVLNLSFEVSTKPNKI